MRVTIFILGSDNWVDADLTMTGCCLLSALSGIGVKGILPCDRAHDDHKSWPAKGLQTRLAPLTAGGWT
jgi:hypothetical protein